MTLDDTVYSLELAMNQIATLQREVEELSNRVSDTLVINDTEIGKMAVFKFNEKGDLVVVVDGIRTTTILSNEDGDLLSARRVGFNVPRTEPQSISNEESYNNFNNSLTISDLVVGKTAVFKFNADHALIVKVGDKTTTIMSKDGDFVAAGNIGTKIS